MSERFMIDDAGTLIDKQNAKCYDYVTEVKPLLEAQQKRIQELNIELIQKQIQINKNTNTLHELINICKDYNITIEDTPDLITEYIETHDTIQELRETCKKYNIPFKDVDKVFNQYIDDDNEEYLEKIKGGQ